MKNQLSTTPTKITHKMWSRTGRSGLAGPVNTAQERAMQEERESRISTKNNAITMAISTKQKSTCSCSTKDGAEKRVQYGFIGVEGCCGLRKSSAWICSRFKTSINVHFLELTTALHVHF
jgi:hypothetical protein